MIYWTGVDNWDIIITNAQKHNMRTTTAFSDFMGIYQLSVEINRIEYLIELKVTDPNTRKNYVKKAYCNNSKFII